MLLCSIAGHKFSSWITFIACKSFLLGKNLEANLIQSERKRVELLKQILLNLEPWFAKEVAYETLFEIEKEIVT